jgi:cell pole-organizing protein PopZ
MEELLASIRKAIHDDIGEVPASMSAKSSGTLQPGSMRELHVKVGDEAANAAAEIQQLREKINRSRGADAPAYVPPSVSSPPREAVTPRSASLAAALQAETPRRSWRDIEPQPKLRPTIVEQEYVPPSRAEYQPRQPDPAPEPHPYAQPAYPQASWQDEPAALPPPRDSYRPRHEDAPNMLSGDASQAVQSAFNRLADTVLSRATGDRSIEDMTRELLRGMLKQWLDDNLPTLVERLVREEIERVARNGR